MTFEDKRVRRYLRKPSSAMSTLSYGVDPEEGPVAMNHFEVR